MRRLGNKGVMTCEITNHLYCILKLRGTYSNITWYDMHDLNNNLMFRSDLEITIILLIILYWLPNLLQS